MTLSSEVELIRESLEGALSPTLAMSVLFDALEQWGGGIPDDLAGVLAVVRGPLAQILDERLGRNERDQLISDIEKRLAEAPSADQDPDDGALGLDLEIDDLEIDLAFVGEEDSDDGDTLRVTALNQPVKVLVTSVRGDFAERLLLALGPARIYPFTVGNEADLRKASFSRSPVFVVVDSESPPSIEAHKLAVVLRGLPDRTLPVIWSEDANYGRQLRAEMEELASRGLFISKGDGIEPLLDLILARFRQASHPPPPLS